MTATTIRAANPLPAVTVTGHVKTTQEPDTVSRDWAERSPEIHWPTPMFNGASEIFAHNLIVINASCEKVWDHLIHAELWPHWCAFCGKVRIWGGTQVLQKGGKFTWVSTDLPQDVPIAGKPPVTWVDSKVVEYDPPSRLGFSTWGRGSIGARTLVDSYYNWYIKPISPKKCVVTFEEVATGVAARFGRGAYPELVHVSHDDWLQGLKRISEARR